MTYKIITQTESGKLELWTSESSLSDFVAEAKARGYLCTGYNKNPYHRPELRGQPEFAGLCGPMYDGGPIRYESTAAYQRLSA